MTARRELWNCAWRMTGPLTSQRSISTTVLDRLSQPVQAYISTSRDPFLNLSIEHYLLQKTAPESAVLFLYVNRPSIIIGRNQNPWLEVNLALLNFSNGRPQTEPSGLGAVDLVRRRSGGGTVFHDEGNVNWTVISPSANFTRDKHAEMVVRALRKLGVDRARVNERHDIVLDQGEETSVTDAHDTHVTPYQSDELRALKVSGSAYKLTRQRALHHGTCLLSSPNLNVIPHYLHSPAKPYIKARGVESVSSPVGNIMLANDEFMDVTTQSFQSMYNNNDKLPATEVGQDWLGIEDVRKGNDELKSHEWTFLQTPHFDLSSEPHDKSSNALQQDEAPLPFELVAKYGVITGAKSDGSVPLTELVGRKLHETTNWDSVIPLAEEALSMGRRARLVAWLQHMLPSIDR